MPIPTQESLFNKKNFQHLINEKILIEKGEHLVYPMNQQDSSIIFHFSTKGKQSTHIGEQQLTSQNAID